MKATVQIHTDGDETAVLTAPEGHVRALARLTQTGILELIAKWVEAEVRRPDHHPADLLQALARCNAQIQASMSGNFVKADMSEQMLQLVHETIDAEWHRTFTKVKNRLAELAK